MSAEKDNSIFGGVLWHVRGFGEPMEFWVVSPESKAGFATTAIVAATQWVLSITQTLALLSAKQVFGLKLPKLAQNLLSTKQEDLLSTQQKFA